MAFYARPALFINFKTTWKCYIVNFSEWQILIPKKCAEIFYFFYFLFIFQCLASHWTFKCLHNAFRLYVHVSYLRSMSAPVFRKKKTNCLSVNKAAAEVIINCFIPNYCRGLACGKKGMCQWQNGSISPLWSASAWCCSASLLEAGQESGETCAVPWWPVIYVLW